MFAHLKIRIGFSFVWGCGCCCFSKCFSCRNTSKWCFFYFLKIIFDISTLKWSKNTKIYSFKKRRSKNSQILVWPQCQTGFKIVRVGAWILTLNLHRIDSHIIVILGVSGWWSEFIFTNRIELNWLINWILIFETNFIITNRIV